MKLDAFLTLCKTIIEWLVGAIKFLGSFVLTILGNIGNFFGQIFNDDIFTILNSVISTLTTYLGSYGATLFVSLFILSFMIIIAGFLLRLLRGRVNYDTALHRIDYYNKYDAMHKK